MALCRGHWDGVENLDAAQRRTSLPDDLQAATMRSTGDLQPGDQVRGGVDGVDTFELTIAPR